MKAKKVLVFIALFLWVIGVLGGIGYTIYLGEYVITAGIVVSGLFGIPTVKKFVNFMLE